MVYRESFGRQCLRCATVLGRLTVGPYEYERCGTCGGIFIGHHTLARMWEKMAPGQLLPDFTPRSDGKGERPCPTCHAPMRRVELLIVPIDHCPADGIWFDPEELAVALAGAALPRETWFQMFVAQLQEMS
jgi:Zn-finger nucleic acid-binding protein